MKRTYVSARGDIDETDPCCVSGVPLFRRIKRSVNFLDMCSPCRYPDPYYYEECSCPPNQKINFEEIRVYLTGKSVEKKNVVTSPHDSVYYVTIIKGSAPSNEYPSLNLLVNSKHKFTIQNGECDTININKYVREYTASHIEFYGDFSGVEPQEKYVKYFNDLFSKIVQNQNMKKNEILN